MTTVPQWKLRRLAPRALRVTERRAVESVALQRCESTLVPVAKEFIASYDRVKGFNTKWRREMSEGHGAVRELILTIRRWLPRLAADVPHFERSTFADTAVPDDVMEDAERLKETVLDHQELAAIQEGVRVLPYASDLLAELDPAYDAANEEWSEAEHTDSEYQRALTNTRRLAGQLQHELVVFRQTLASVVGTSDLDYQKLRVVRASAPDPEDDAQAPRSLGTTPPPGADGHRRGFGLNPPSTRDSSTRLNSAHDGDRDWRAGSMWSSLKSR